MDKFKFETAGIYYSRIFRDVSCVWNEIDEIDHMIWKDTGKPASFISPRREVNIGPTLGM